MRGRELRSGSCAAVWPAQNRRLPSGGVGGRQVRARWLPQAWAAGQAGSQLALRLWPDEAFMPVLRVPPHTELLPLRAGEPVWLEQLQGREGGPQEAWRGGHVAALERGSWRHATADAAAVSHPLTLQLP